MSVVLLSVYLYHQRFANFKGGVANASTLHFMDTGYGYSMGMTTCTPIATLKSLVSLLLIIGTMLSVLIP